MESEKLEELSLEELVEKFKANKVQIAKITENNKRLEEKLKVLGDPKNSY